MVKLTIVGRVEDGLALAEDQAFHVNHEDNTSFLFYKQQAKFLLKQVSIDSSSLHPKMTILIDHNSFHLNLQSLVMDKKICIITLAESSYPRKLLFQYLQDLRKEVEKFEEIEINTISKPYSFVRFSKIVRSIRKQYMDTRTQANLSKLNALPRQELHVVTQHLKDLIQRRQFLEISENASSDSRVYTVPPIWTSQFLQDIALKWTPVTIIIVVILVIFKASLILTDDYLISTMT